MSEPDTPGQADTATSDADRLAEPGDDPTAPSGEDAVTGPADRGVEVEATPPARAARRPNRLPTTVTAVDRLLSVYAQPGPYCSVYLALDPEPTGGTLRERWTVLRDDLAEREAPDDALDAIAARLALPGPPDVGGVGIIAASDGRTVVDHGLEPPRHDFATFDTLPYAAPMLEWQQRRVSHVVVTVDDDGADLVVFGPDHFTRVDGYQLEPEQLVNPIAQTAIGIRAELLVISGERSVTAALADRLATEIPATCRIVTEPAHHDADALTDAVVRQVSDVVARATANDLREGRFLRSHDGAVEGRAATVDALVSGAAERVLLHDDPNDQERIWVGKEPYELSATARSGYAHARLVDALIRSAILQGVEVRIVPSTGAAGPADDTAAIIGDAGMPPSTDGFSGVATGAVGD